jgi:hypothetical protein
MRRRPLELHPGAEADYLNSLAWYRDRSFPTSLKFDNAFWQAVQAVEDSPERWPVYFSDFRRYTLHQFPFSIVYRIEPPRVFVLAVVHGRRRPGYWKDRA